MLNAYARNAALATVSFLTAACAADVAAARCLIDSDCPANVAACESPRCEPTGACALTPRCSDTSVCNGDGACFDPGPSTCETNSACTFYQCTSTACDPTDGCALTFYPSGTPCAGGHCDGHGACK